MSTIPQSLAKTVLEDVFNSAKSPAEIVKEKGYAQIDDASMLGSAVTRAIVNNPKAVDDYKNGKDTAAKYLVGQVMKITKGRAKPDLVNRLVKEGLEALK